MSIPEFSSDNLATNCNDIENEAVSETVNLQEFLNQKITIEKLTMQVKNLEEERDAFKKEVEFLRKENDLLKRIDQSFVSSSPPSRSLQFRKQSWELSLSKHTLSKPGATSAMSRLDNETEEIFDLDCEVDSSNKQPVESTPIRRRDAGVDIVNREVASHGESTCYESVEERRSEESDTSCTPNLSLKSPLKKTMHKVSSRRLSRRSDSTTLYELSADLREKTIECLEKKYGGKEKANHAALQIQQCYRHWVLNKSFLRMRASTGRKRSITMPEKHFEKLKKTSLVFYGPDNPVMIIDEENENRIKNDTIENKLQANQKLCVASTGEKLGNIEEELLNDLEVTVNNAEDNRSDTLNKGNDGEIAVNQIESEDAENTGDVKWSLSRTSSESSQLDSQYDIIDDSQVLTVVGKEVDTVAGSRVSVLAIHDDTPDGISYSSESLYTSRQYEPTFDKSMHKRQFRIGVNLFNWKPPIGVDYLIDNGHLEEDVKSIAEFLRKETTISKQKISEYFSNIRDEFSMKVLLEFAKSFQFAGKGVDEALRQFQSYFKLTGEAQTVEKFLQVFSDRYVECNPGKVTNNPDSILLLAFALAMLNTDLHNQNVKRRMTMEEFLKNLKGTDDGNDFDHDMLSDMYNRIQKNEFATGADHTTQLHQIENSFVGKIPNLAATHRQFVKLFTLEEVVDPNRKEKPHRRLAFLFNDLLILAKPRGKSGVHGTGHIFSCKASYSLLGKKVAEFCNEHYPHGVLLLQKLDNKAIATFSMVDEAAKHSFVEELDEYIRETNGMENIRIALSKTNQLAFQTRRKEGTRCKSLFVSNNSLKSRDSGFHGMDKTETASLMDLRVGNSLEAEDAQGRANGSAIMASSSMNDINQADSDTEDKYENLVRTSSATSLDPSCLSDTNFNAEQSKPQPHVSARSSLLMRKTFFGHIATKWRRPLSIGAHGDKGLMSMLQGRHLAIQTTVSPSIPP